MTPLSTHRRARPTLRLVVLTLFAAIRPAGAGERLLVATSIAPLADLVAKVGGAHVDVLTLVPPGASPHTYELQPSHVAQVARARLLVLNGAGLEFWAPKLVAAVANPALAVIDTSQGVELIAEGAHGANPHLWLDPQQAGRQAARIRDALAAVDPAHTGDYHAGAESLLRELATLDAEIAQQVASWRQRQFVSFHPAWVYFARRYGVHEAAVVELFPGREPSPGEMARVIDTTRRIGARAIFVEPQFSPKAATVIADECGARVVELDPLGSTVRDGYVALMRYNVAQMASVLK